MIVVTVYRESGKYRGFRCQGHAGYGAEGDDIICAAVSALTVNTVNSIDRFTEDTISVESREGLIDLSFAGEVSEKSRLLMDSMISGLQDVQGNYGSEFIRLDFEEV